MLEGRVRGAEVADHQGDERMLCAQGGLEAGARTLKNLDGALGFLADDEHAAQAGERAARFRMGLAKELQVGRQCGLVVVERVVELSGGSVGTAEVHVELRL